MKGIALRSAGRARPAGAGRAGRPRRPRPGRDPGPAPRELAQLPRLCGRDRDGPHRGRAHPDGRRRRRGGGHGRGRDRVRGTATTSSPASSRDGRTARRRWRFLDRPGDGVDGYAREAVVRPATWFTTAPEGFSHAEAATLTTAGLTAWRALVVNGGLKAGDVVLVLGTGGVSIFALQLAKAMGAAVVVTSSSTRSWSGRARWAPTTPSTTASTRIGASRRATGPAGAGSTTWSRSAARARWHSRSRRCASAGTSR